MTRRRKLEDTSCHKDALSPAKHKKQNTQDDKVRTRTTRQTGGSEDKEVQNPNSSPRTRSANKKEDAASPQKDNRRKSNEYVIQTDSPLRSLRKTKRDLDKKNEVTRSKSSERLKSVSSTNSLSPKGTAENDSSLTNKEQQKAKQTPKKKETKDGSEEEATKTSDTEVNQIHCDGNINSSATPGERAEDLSDKSCMTLDHSRRSSNRVRKLTHKAAEAEDSRRVRTQSKSSSPRKPNLSQDNLLTDTDHLAESSDKTVTSSDLDIQIICDEPSAKSSSTDLSTSNDNDNTITDIVHNCADAIASSVSEESNNSQNTENLSATQNDSFTRSVPKSSALKPDEMVSQSFSAPDGAHISRIKSASQKSWDGENICMCTKSTNKLTVEQSQPREDHGNTVLVAAREEEQKVRADVGVQVSPREDRSQLISVGIQVDDGHLLPWQQVSLETDHGGVDLMRPKTDQSSNSAFTDASINLNTLLTMSEADEKVLGGVSALIKDSLLQIQGMRHFIIHDLPSLTHVACFQTADKIAVSGTIQGISRAWSILTNIEHNVHNKDPKSKKSVKIQWTGKTGIKKIVEFRKTAESQKAPVSLAKDVKPVTVFVDIKSEKEEVLSSPIRESGPAPPIQQHSEEILNNSSPNQTNIPKKQVSLLSGKSYLMSHIKIEGHIGVPALSDSTKKSAGDKTGSGLESARTPYTITVADNNGENEDVVMDELVVSANNIQKELMEKARSTLDPQNADVIGTQTRDDISDDDDYDDDYDDDDDCGTVVWHASDRNKNMNVTKNAEFLCDICPQVFTSQPDLTSHRQHAHSFADSSGDVPSFVECPTCFQRFRCRLELHRHEQRSHSLVIQLPKANPVSFGCNVCGKKFSEKRYLTTHLKRHTGIKRHRCHICGWRFFEAHKLKFHLETHKAEADRQLPYRCTICKRQYHNRQSWNDHMNTHTGSKPYKCEVCGTGFAHRIGLHRHKLTHEKECQYKCTYCNRGFKVKANLKAHMTIHTGVGKHTCSVCKKVFTVATSLRRHKCQVTEGSQETKEDQASESPYMFMCGVCNMTFPTLKEAEVHSLTHVDGITDMSLVGVQVEEVEGETNILNSDPNDTATTYILQDDNSGKAVVLASNAQDGEGLVDEVEKIQIAASTLADLSTLSKDGESSFVGQDTYIQEVPPTNISSFVREDTRTPATSSAEQEVSGTANETPDIAQFVQEGDKEKCEETSEVPPSPRGQTQDTSPGDLPELASAT